MSVSTRDQDSAPNLGMGYRLGAVLVGGLSWFTLPLIILTSLHAKDPTFVIILTAITFFLFGFLLLYIGITGNQRSWAARLLVAIGNIFFWLFAFSWFS
jgi:hypothetical protein